MKGATDDGGKGRWDMQHEGTTRAQELYARGELRAAIEALNGAVRARPTEGGARAFLAELLCIDGNLERADQQLEVLAGQDPGTHLGVALWRQLIRAERWRQQFFLEGRVPEFLGSPPERLKLNLRASIHLRQGQLSDAANLLSQSEAERPHPHGTTPVGRFDDLRDLDDLTASVLELLTSTGKYYWVPLERVRSLVLKKPARPRDLLWRQATVTIESGPEGEVYLPTIYAPLSDETDERSRLGRATDWSGGEGAPVRGRGLRTYLVGEEARTALELGELTIEG